MTPKQLHDQIMQARCVCPTTGSWEYKAGFIAHQKYKSVEDIVRFWLNDDVLWNKGYDKYLSQQVKKLFIDVRQARSKAISDTVSRFLDETK